MLGAVFSKITAAPGWFSKIRTGHPRIFFNDDLWPSIRQRALSEESGYYNQMKKEVDNFPSNPTTRDWGFDVAKVAFVYRMSGRQKYLDLARRMLEESVAWYHQRNADGWGANWWSFSRINALAAYDWIYNDLTPTQRENIIVSFLDHIEFEQQKRGLKRHSLGGTDAGYYGSNSLRWYAGLAAYNDGIDDSRASWFLESGYDQHQKVINHRKKMAGDDGGGASSSLNYLINAYPWAEFNFFQSWQSATGEDIADQYTYIGMLPTYVYWNWLPGPRWFGMGDAYHENPEMPTRHLYTFMGAIMHYFGDAKPEWAAQASWIRTRLPGNDQTWSDKFPVFAFFLTNEKNAPSPRGIENSQPAARHFSGMGQVFFRSGSGTDDTYAQFVTGGLTDRHRHFDHNHFMIYKKGYVSIDAGTRPEPGNHLSNYYARTIAHNTITIRMPGEKMPGYWGKKAPDDLDRSIPNDGGQQTTHGNGSTPVAFETTEHFSYLASDASQAYNGLKCDLALRQFVHVQPDYFIIYDRVVSTDKSYPKRWLLQTAREPDIDGMSFENVQGDGKLVCRTLLPGDAVIQKVGGPGKQFLADGTNWLLPREYVEASWSGDNDDELLGQWRIEVKPGEQRTKDRFLHVMRASDTGNSADLGSPQLVCENGFEGVQFSHGGKEITVLFGTSGSAAGHISITHNGTTVIDRALTRNVTPQKT